MSLLIVATPYLLAKAKLAVPVPIHIYMFTFTYTHVYVYIHTQAHRVGDTSEDIFNGVNHLMDHLLAKVKLAVPVVMATTDKLLGSFIIIRIRRVMV